MSSRKVKSLIVLVLLLSLSAFSQSSKKFIIILDAGHGGKDPGNSNHGFVEKKIALLTTLKLEKYLENDNDIQVIFTRKTDSFVELDIRPKIANKINADLFISIHCNSVKSPTPFGTETFVMGLSRSNTNLEIAKSENSVIFLEKNYKKTYKGFDPNKSETLIGLKILQEEYLNRSIKLASKIENNFSHKLKRNSRGIKQSPLWVLDASFMPSVLIELGFLSNKKEGAYLNSENGQDNMAKAIADAIVSYKNDYFGNFNSESRSRKAVGTSDDKVNKSNSVVEKRSKDEKQFEKQQTSKAIFKVQIATSNKKLKLEPKNFKGLKNISMAIDHYFYKYMYGETFDYDEAKLQLREVKTKGYTSAFLIAFKNGKKISVQEAIK